MVEKLLNKLKSDIHFKDILKGSAITFVLKVAGMAVSYFLIYVISKKLGAEGVGFFNFLLNILISLGMMVGLGMNMSVLRYVGQFNNKDNQAKIKLIYKYYLAIATPLSIVIGLTIYFCADYFVAMAGKEQVYIKGFKVIGIILPFYALNQISIEYIRGLKQLKISELIRSLLRPLIMVVAIYALFNEKLSKIDTVYILFVAILVNFLVSQATILNKIKNLPRISMLEFSLQEFVKTSLPMMISSLSSTLFLALPVFFLDFYASQAEVGVYSVANRLASLVSIILIVINTIAAPKFSELYWANNMKELQKVISQSTKLMFWIAFIISLGLIIFGRFFLGIFGEEFKAGYTVLIILVISQVINAATGSVGIFMNMSGRQKILKNIFLIALAILLVLYMFIGEGLNMYYASICVAVLQIFISIVPTYIIFKELRIKTYFSLF